MCKTLCHGIGRGGLRHVARALQSYKKLRHPQGGRRAEREQTLPRREQADKNRDHPAKKYLAPTAVWPTAAAVWQLKNRRGAAKSGLARPTPRALFLTPSSCGDAKGHRPGGKKAPAGGRQRQKSGQRLCPFAGFMYICNAATRGPRQPRGRHGPRGCCRLTTKNISR